MGCGTGILLQQDTFKIILKFQPKISSTSPIYTNFESAMRGFIGDLLDPVNPWTPHLSSGKVNTIDVLMHGPIQTVDQQQQFNRGMNRLLWGVRMVCGNAAAGGAPAPSGFAVNVFKVQKNNGSLDDPNWDFEDTCNASLKATYKKKASAKKPKAAAKGKAAPKRRPRAKR